MSRPFSNDIKFQFDSNYSSIFNNNNQQLNNNNSILNASIHSNVTHTSWNIPPKFNTMNTNNMEYQYKQKLQKMEYQYKQQLQKEQGIYNEQRSEERRVGKKCR